MADLSSILGGMVQGFKDFGTGLVDMFGTGGAAIGDAIASIQSGRATTKNQDDFRKWLYNTDSTKDAAAKGLGTVLNGVSTVADVIPGAQAVTANPLFNGIQGAIGGVSDELKMAGENADLGRAAQRAGVGAASGLASGYAGQGLAKTGNKLLSNGLTRGAVSGALGGGIANAGYTGIEGGSVQDMINAGLYGAQTGALVGGTTGLARELIKPTYKMDVALSDDEKAARIANIDDQIGKLDLSTPEGNARYAELTAARENYEPKTYYHGSPELDITEFDINRAGKNTRSGEKAIYFTDTPEAAEEFAYERIPTDSIFVDNKGKRGGVYEANLDMRNTLDLDNLTDAQIRELWNYASPLGQLDGQEKFIQNMTDYRDKYHNAQAAKSLLDLDRLKESPYDSFSATMYPNTDNKAKEYAIFDASKAKITKSPKTVADLMNEPKQKTVADLMLSPEQEEFFKGSVVRDENGNLLPMYHGTRGNFTVFGDDRPYDGSNSHASVGHWFTPTEEGAQNFANSIWYGDGDPKVMKTYLNIKNPKIYETVDNSAAIEPLVKRLQELELDSSKLSDTELYRKNIYHASTVQNMINLADKDTAVDWLSREKGYEKQKAIKLVDEIADIKRLADEKANLQNEISELKYGDAYQRFKTDLYKVDGQTANDANAGGVGMALNDKNSIKRYVDNLKNEGYDGIIIKGTNYDADVMGGPNDQYVVFDSNQIKSVNNKKPTKSANINYALAGLLGTGGLAAALAAAAPKEDKKKKSEVK